MSCKRTSSDVTNFPVSQKQRYREWCYLTTWWCPGSSWDRVNFVVCTTSLFCATSLISRGRESLPRRRASFWSRKLGGRSCLVLSLVVWYCLLSFFPCEYFLFLYPVVSTVATTVHFISLLFPVSCFYLSLWSLPLILLLSIFLKQEVGKGRVREQERHVVWRVLV